MHILLFGMKTFVNRLRELTRDSFDTCQIVDACLRDRLHAAELSQEFAPPLRAESLDLFQRRPGLALPAPVTMARDSKTMGFVAELLNHV
jgi:hypothetical protein